MNYLNYIFLYLYDNRKIFYHVNWVICIIVCLLGHYVFDMILIFVQIFIATGMMRGYGLQECRDKMIDELKK